MGRLDQTWYNGTGCGLTLWREAWSHNISAITPHFMQKSGSRRKWPKIFATVSRTAFSDFDCSGRLKALLQQFEESTLAQVCQLRSYPRTNICAFFPSGGSIL